MNFSNNVTVLLAFTKMYSTEYKISALSVIGFLDNELTVGMPLDDALKYLKESGFKIKWRQKIDKNNGRILLIRR
ncbi:PASTA domain-containing protein [Bacillus sp. NEB1478]|uniref:PASTA domain-containing protein n=1 Tax=Bacillus sp. NEB1478 TaxID=3073816 RepID=UPI0028738326|nr:PASTA domain-containing protein [Bacillus sp. NEB1478]WNB92320.1 PASTA domain-containing protein [Bacillus sp. NEB1478]